jgi:hypothetical protein
MEDKKDILSKFDSLKNNEPYKVPDSYFNTLLSRVQDKIETGENNKMYGWSISYGPVLKLSLLVIGIAFIVFIGFEVLKPVWNNSQTRNDQVDELALYIDNQVYSLDDLTLLNASEPNKNELKTKVTEQNDTINFLLNNNISIEDIIYEL